MNKIAVLLSAYNGQQYIKKQIESILDQRGEFDLSIYVRDDGSSDNTMRILEEYEKEKKIILLQGHNVGPAKSFLSMIHEINNFDYYAFSDQDDVWYPDKLQRAIATLPDKGYYSYFSNAEVTDENLNRLQMQVYKKRPRVDFKTFSVAGGALGCTSVFNRTIGEIIQKRPLPRAVFMHDFYLHELCLALGGRIYYDDNPSILYRQHFNNTIGVSKSKKEALSDNIKSLLFKNPISISDQAADILDKYGNLISEENAKWLDQVSEYNKNMRTRCAFSFNREMKFKDLHSSLEMRIELLLGHR